MNRPVVFILDVDGVMTTGQFLYSSEGKQLKIFGPDDSDALSLLADFLEIRFISSDKRGFQISQARVSRDMGFQLDLVPSTGRVDWILNQYRPELVIYMGDGFYDSLVMQKVGYAIAPSNADAHTKTFAHYTTTRPGGDRAVSEACVHVFERFFGLSRMQLLANVLGPFS